MRKRPHGFALYAWRNQRNQRNLCRDKHLRRISIGEVSEKIPYADASRYMRRGGARAPSPRPAPPPPPSRYMRRGAPGAPSLRSAHCTLIFGGVTASRCSRLASIIVLGTLPRKQSALIWLRVA